MADTITNLDKEVANEPFDPGNYAMVHFNNNMCCVMDTETTGLDPNFHEIVQICVIALDSNFNPLKGMMPFYVNLKPNYPERVDAKAIEINKLDMANIMNTGFDRDKAADMFEAWFKKLGIKNNKYGNGNKIMPLGQNYSFDKAFIQAWLGVEQYNQYFHYHYRDTMNSALFMNDRAGMRAEKVPFPKVNLQYLATTLGIGGDKAHDALADCLKTAEVYKRLLKAGGLF
jgi:DNA polymerase III epsilon subunit-like protein